MYICVVATASMQPRYCHQMAVRVEPIGSIPIARNLFVTHSNGVKESCVLGLEAGLGRIRRFTHGLLPITLVAEPVR